MILSTSLEPFLVFVMFALSAGLSFMYWRLAKHEMNHGNDDFRFDIHRAAACGGLFWAGSSLASLISILIGAQTTLIRWPTLGLLFWISNSAAWLLFSVFRYEARVKKHPFWPRHDYHEKKTP